ncbi:hypothetical protein MVEN_01583200 [Mycena venus]|uniref:Uncharacterized protein n=1 Tax=Mycena venus TaxID=2733690 RepID=A0A8H6XQI9_9AGAR|nr:hypothetical protein MVEN_01583200 [Mycena venus]
MKLATAALSLIINLYLGLPTVSAQTLLQSAFDDVAINGTDLSPPIDSDTTITYNTVLRCGYGYTTGAGVAVSSTDISAVPSSSSTVGEVFVTSSASASPNVTSQSTSSAANEPNTPVVADATPIAGSSRLSTPMIIGISLGVTLIAILAAIILLLLRRSRRNRGYGSRVVVDPEAAPSVEEIRIPGAGAAVALTIPREQELNLHPGRKLAQLEYQTRILQQEIEALKHSNPAHFESEYAKGYAVNVPQKEKLDFFAAKSRELKTYREPDSADDAPPDYESSSSV